MNRDPFGGKSASFDDPLAMLSACHERIRRQLDTLSRLERHLPEHGCDTDARVAARAILRYFDAAAPHHHEDEEVDVFPRVVARAPECAALVARLEEEHAALAANWRHLRPLLAGIASGQRAVLPPKLVRDATAAYIAHIEVEESELIPLARELLPPEEVAAVGLAMARRRGVAPAGAQITLE